MELCHPLGEDFVSPLALEFHVLDAPLVPRQRLAERVEELGDRLLPLREVSLGRGARLLQPGVRQRQELLVVLRERLGRQPCELPGQTGPLLLGAGGRLGVGAAQDVEFVGQDRACGLCRRCGVGQLIEPDRLLRRHRLGIGQSALGQARRGGRAGAPHQVEHHAHDQPEGQAQDDPEDHQATVTAGCDDERDGVAQRRTAVVHTGPSR